MKTIIRLLYRLISLLDKYDYKHIHNKLLDGYKTINDIDISTSGIKILTDTGFKPITNIMVSKPFEQYTVILENGYKLIGADRHIVFNENYDEVFIEDLHVGDYIITDEGKQRVISIIYDKLPVFMCDLTVNDANHRFYSNGILSHNSTTTAIYCLWKILFNTDKSGLILSKSGPAGVDLLSKIKDMYRYLPYYLKCGTMKWNQSSIAFDNNSSISTEAFSPTAGLGKTINFLILDEFAWCNPNEVDLFYNNIIPTVTTISDSNVCIMSTQNGFNLFYKLWRAAKEDPNCIYAPFKVDWDQVPQWNVEKCVWEKRTDKWKNQMIGILGSEEAFYYQYGTQFSASNYCIVSRECLSRIRMSTQNFVNREDINPPIMHSDRLFWKPSFDAESLRTGWFLILADLAEGGGTDTNAPDGSDSTVFNIIQITDKDKFEQVGYWKSAHYDLEHAALEYWLLCTSLFNNERCAYSIEWNTYGALFYRYLLDLNEPDYMMEASFRFNVAPEGFDNTLVIQYKKTGQDDNIPGMPQKHRSTIPGIRWTGESKKTACSLLRMELEKENLIVTDEVTVGEIENFEDKNGNGSYKSSYGHDDIIMTLVQIPMLKQTPKYKDMMEEFDAHRYVANKTSSFYDGGIQSVFDRLTKL